MAHESAVVERLTASGSGSDTGCWVQQNSVQLRRAQSSDTLFVVPGAALRGGSHNAVLTM